VRSGPASGSGVPETVVAVIPARGGSKGVPRKNVREVAGHPLIAYSIAAALASQSIGRVVVSTDDPEIADAARTYGAEVPFMRPSELAADDTPDLPVFQHALQWLEQKEQYRPDVVVHLRPTSPFRRVADIDHAVDLLQSHPEADAVRAVCEPFQNPYKMWRLAGDGSLEPLLTLPGMPDAYNRPRQSLPMVLWQTASIDVTRRTTILDGGSMTGRRILPFILPEDSWVDVDSELMLQFATYLVLANAVDVQMPVRQVPR
jgi:CMP-N,N'-diacetyllegionaminic acid synthase